MCPPVNELVHGPSPADIAAAEAEADALDEELAAVEEPELPAAAREEELAGTFREPPCPSSSTASKWSPALR